ncbi:MAG: hypothetical protein M0P53_08665, partial [Candidatus Cloacimonas sp.]|nr:hypothetical protein [Candidatus Cloacimonas sp.]
MTLFKYRKKNEIIWQTIYKADFNSKADIGRHNHSDGGVSPSESERYNLHHLTLVFIKNPLNPYNPVHPRPILSV